MLSSNPQDEAILSERNEQELFQSESSSGENDSNEQLEEEEEQIQEKDQTSTFQENQIIKEDTKKKDVFPFVIQIKETIFQKIKAYIGFGNSDLITNQKIGSIFLFPISSNWSLKAQVTVTQILIAITSLILFTGMQYIGQEALVNSTQRWTWENARKLITAQIFEISSGFLEQLMVSKTNDMLLLNLTIDLLNSQPLQYTGPLYEMNQQLPSATREYLPQNGMIDSYTLLFSTFTILGNAQLSEKQIRNTLSLNNILFYNYQYMGSYFFWIFENGLMVQYPGINVTNIEMFKDYRLQLYNNLINQSALEVEHIFDPVLNSFVERQTIPILDRFRNKIGLAFCDRQPIINYVLFYQVAQNSQANYTLFFLSSDFIIQFYQQVEYEIDLDAFQDALKTLNLTNSNFSLTSPQIQMNYQFLNETLKNFSIYQGKVKENRILLSIINYEGLILALYYPYYVVKDRIVSQKETFEQIKSNVTTTFLPIIIAIPSIHIVLCILYMIREIKPLQKITEFADQLLKKSQKFDEKQIDDQEGGGLIQQLTSILKKLMVNLNKSKSLKKSEIIEFYNNQTYPMNIKSKDVKPILEEIEKIKSDYLVKDPGIIQFPNLDD